jgi:hypothetical protein
MFYLNISVKSNIMANKCNNFFILVLFIKVRAIFVVNFDKWSAHLLRVCIHNIFRIWRQFQEYRIFIIYFLNTNYIPLQLMYHYQASFMTNKKKKFFSHKRNKESHRPFRPRKDVTFFLWAIKLYIATPASSSRISRASTLRQNPIKIKYYLSLALQKEMYWRIWTSYHQNLKVKLNYYYTILIEVLNKHLQYRFNTKK